MTDETIYLMALAQIPGVGSVTARHLISYCGGVKEVFQADYRKLIRIPGVGENLVKTILRNRNPDQALSEWETCRRNNITVCTYRDNRYPKRLLSLYDAPLILYLDGNADLNSRRTVGIVGTRRITPYGRDVTEQIVRDLVPYSPLIVSGLAYGVDVVAHRAALRNELPTLGVMATGIDQIYPREHYRIAQQMKKNGGVLTEFVLGTRPDYPRFPARNRIIAGLSDVLILVESSCKGGGLITAEFASNYHRDVYAVPGGIFQPMSEGCNRLIGENKAALFYSVQAMAEDLRWNRSGTEAGLSLFPDEPPAVFDGFTGEESQLLALLKRQGQLHIDELYWYSGMPPGKVATLLLSLEFKGVVKSLPGKKYGLS